MRASGEAVVPGVSPPLPLLLPSKSNDQLFHFGFTRRAHLKEQLVRGREDFFFGYELAISAGTPLPDDVVKYYVDVIASDPEALRGTFELYRAFETTIVQNEQRKTQRLTLPVLALGGALGIGEGATHTLKLVADDVQSVVIPGAGHWIAEEAPDDVVSALTAFLAPYRGEATNLGAAPPIARRGQGWRTGATRARPLTWLRAVAAEAERGRARPPAARRAAAY
jgi:pimeloyl-ACP methyl ester carboxylesterase